MTTRNDLTDLAHRLILRAARKAPAPLADRLREEWLADLQTRSGSLARLSLALGCCWATAVITRDFGVPQLATSGAVSGLRLHLGDLPPNLPPLARRALTILVIAGLHVLVIYGFASGLFQHVVASIPQAIQASIPVEIRPTHVPPAVPPATFKLQPIPPWDPPLEHSQPIDFAPEDPPAAPPGGGDDGAVDPPRPLPAAVRVMGGPGKGFPMTDDFYPAASRRIAETGAATVQVCVDTQGRLTADPILTGASGSRRIDDGALNLARAGSGHYRPSTEDGRLVDSCYPYRIRFVLN